MMIRQIVKPHSLSTSMDVLENANPLATLRRRQLSLRDKSRLRSMTLSMTLYAFHERNVNILPTNRLFITCRKELPWFEIRISKFYVVGIDFMLDRGRSDFLYHFIDRDILCYWI